MSRTAMLHGAANDRLGLPAIKSKLFGTPPGSPPVGLDKSGGSIESKVAIGRAVRQPGPHPDERGPGQARVGPLSPFPPPDRHANESSRRE